MVDTTTIRTRTAEPLRVPRYAGWIGKTVGSGLYRHTIGRLADSRPVRLALLAGVPLFWIAALHIGPIFQMGRISFMPLPPLKRGGVQLSLQLERPNAR